MQCLIDTDVILYEVGFSCEKVENGVVIPASWDFAQDLVDKKIALICDEAGGAEPPVLFMTNTPHLNKTLNKERKLRGEEVKEYVNNFRFDVAKDKEYKAGRSTQKPFHFRNLIHYLRSAYTVHVNEVGLEADDAMCIMQYTRWKEKNYDTIICSRDKDVRQCPGWHYSWESGKQAAIGPLLVDPLGHLEIKNAGEKDSKGRAKPIKVFGTGDKFFYYQMLVGDQVDNVGGIKGRGPFFAYNLLKDATSSRECYELVAEKYVQFYEDEWKVHMREMADLLWMVRELDENGEKIKWKPPKNEG
jgi:hypothetical protein